MIETYPAKDLEILNNLSKTLSERLKSLAPTDEAQKKCAERVRVAIEKHHQCLKSSPEIELTISTSNDVLRWKESRVGSIFSRSKRKMLRLKSSSNGVPAGYVLLRIDDELEVCSQGLGIKDVKRYFKERKDNLVRLTFSNLKCARVVTDLHDMSEALQRVDDKMDHVLKDVNRCVESAETVISNVETRFRRILKNFENLGKDLVVETCRVVETSTRDFASVDTSNLTSLNTSYLNIASSVFRTCEELDSYLSVNIDETLTEVEEDTKDFTIDSKTYNNLDQTKLDEVLVAIERTAEFAEDLHKVTLRSKQALCSAEQSFRSNLKIIEKRQSKKRVASEYAARWISEYLSLHRQFLETQFFESEDPSIEMRTIVSELRDRWDTLQDTSERSVSQWVNVDTDELYADQASARTQWINSRYRDEDRKVDMPFSEEGQFREKLERAETRMTMFHSVLLNVAERKERVLTPSLEMQERILLQFTTQRMSKIWIETMRRNLCTLKALDKRLCDNCYMNAPLEILLRSLRGEIEESSVVSNEREMVIQIGKWCQIVEQLIKVQELILSSMSFLVHEEESRRDEIIYLHQQRGVEFSMFKDLTMQIHSYLSERDDFDEGLIRLQICDKHEMYLKVLQQALKDLNLSLKLLTGASSKKKSNGHSSSEDKYERVMHVIRTDVVGSVLGLL